MNSVVNLYQLQQKARSSLAVGLHRSDDRVNGNATATLRRGLAEARFNGISTRGERDLFVLGAATLNGIALFISQ